LKSKVRKTKKKQLNNLTPLTANALHSLVAAAVVSHIGKIIKWPSRRWKSDFSERGLAL